MSYFFCKSNRFETHPFLKSLMQVRAWLFKMVMLMRPISSQQESGKVCAYNFVGLSWWDYLLPCSTVTIARWNLLRLTNLSLIDRPHTFTILQSHAVICIRNFENERVSNGLVCSKTNRISYIVHWLKLIYGTLPESSTHTKTLFILRNFSTTVLNPLHNFVRAGIQSGSVV